MGWLRELMRSSPERPRSYGEVARAALASPAWTARPPPKPRSLAALLSKLDRGIDLGWLADRPAVQAALADALGVERVRVASAVGRSAGEADESSARIRLLDLPYSAVLDLRDEALPPGIPIESLHPRPGRPLCWVAGSGAGRTLAGRWLAARGRAAFVAADDWASALALVPPERPVFVELGRGGPGSPPPLADGIVVACPLPPRAAEGWTLVRSPPPGDWVAELVRWALRRLPGDGRLVEAEGVTALQELAQRGSIDCLGTALGLVGLADSRGVAEISRSGLERESDRFVLASLQRALRGEDPTAPTPELAAALFVALAPRALLDDSLPWDSPRPLERWAELLPAEERSRLEVEAVHRALAGRGEPLALPEVEAALSRGASSALRLVRVLARAGLLREGAPAPGFRLAPRWAAGTLVKAARRELVAGPAEGWGEALLVAGEAAPVARALLERARRGGAAAILEDALELPAEPSAPGAAAMELGLRLAGVEVLSGGEIPDEALPALRERALALAVEVGGNLRARIPYPPEDEVAEPTLSAGFHALALSAITEAGLPGGLRHGPAPRRAPRGLLGGSTLDDVAELFSRVVADPPRWLVGALTHAARAEQFHAGAAHRTHSPPAVAGVAADEGGAGPPATTPSGTGHPATWPARALERITQGALDWGSARDAAPWQLEALRLLAESEGMGADAVDDAVWDAFGRAPEPLGGTALDPAREPARTMFARIPPALLRRLLTEELAPVSALPLERVGARTLGALTGLGAALSARPGWLELAPPELFAEALAFVADPAVLAPLWQTRTELLTTRLLDALASGAPHAPVLLASAGPRALPALRRLLAGGAAGLVPAGSRDLIRRHLLGRIEARGSGLRDAFDLLEALG